MSRTALILEDSKTQARLIAAMLERLGWRPVHCEDIASTHSCLKNMRIDAMFLDIFVGSSNTLIHVDRFRAAAPEVPMVLMTAGAQGQDIELTLARARHSRADHVLRKPFTDATVETVLKTIGEDADAGKKRKHVLVIDDSSPVRTIARNALSDAGYRVSDAPSMEAAFANVDIAHVDLVLCDVFMPGMGGLMGMSQIKTTWPSVKIVAMSGGIPQQIRGHDALNVTRQIGADAQLAKPFMPNDLKLLVSELLDSDAAVPDNPSAHFL